MRVAISVCVLIQFIAHLLVANGLTKMSMNVKNPFQFFGNPSQRHRRVLSEPKCTWDSLKSKVMETSEGSALEIDRLLREKGEGMPHADNDIRLFGTNEEPRVTFYKDRASWCPYCQKVWILLEEKKIPYRVGKINMRSYGDKPRDFLMKVPNGLLPAIEIDGRLMTDSIPIMMTLEQLFTGKPMWPAEDSPELERAKALMRLERELFGDWCGLVFRPSYGNQQSRVAFEETLDVVDQQLGKTKGPFFLEDLSIVDLQFVTHIERMLASVPYWAGFKIRGGEGSKRWANIDAWFDAFEKMPSYLASKSDYYTHVQDIPPQYGPGYDDPSTDAEKFSRIINGVDPDEGWRLPLKPFDPNTDVEVVKPWLDRGEAAHRHEAAYNLIKNHEAVVKFSCRGAGEKGGKQFQAALADPYATPNEDLVPDVDAALRVITCTLLESGDDAWRETQLDFSPADGTSSQEERRTVALCLNYLKRRIGVPRDMTYPAARQLRAHLTWAEDQLLA